MLNSVAFLRVFSSIESWLRQQVDADRSTLFYQLVDRAAAKNRAVVRYRDDLKEFADLRNAIVTNVETVTSSLNPMTERSLRSIGYEPRC